MDFVKPLLLVSFFVFAAAGITKRQLPTGLTCDLTTLSNLLASFPVDEMSGQSVCRESATGFALIEPEDYVERQDDVFRFLREICDPDCLPYVVDLVDACYKSSRMSLAQACASNGNGNIQCWQGPILNNGTEVAFNCFSTTNLGQQCTEDCRSSINTIRSTLGCCVNNVFNTTVFGSELAQLQVASGQLWDACGVERVDFCPQPDAFRTVTTDAVDATTDAASRVVSQTVISVMFVILAVKLI